MFNSLLKSMIIFFIVISCHGVELAIGGECPSEAKMITLIKLWGEKYHKTQGSSDTFRYGDVKILQIGNNPSYCPVKAAVRLFHKSFFTKEWSPFYTSAEIMVFKINKNDFGEWTIIKLK